MITVLLPTLLPLHGLLRLKLFYVFGWQLRGSCEWVCTSLQRITNMVRRQQVAHYINSLIKSTLVQRLQIEERHFVEFSPRN